MARYIVDVNEMITLEMLQERRAKLYNGHLEQGLWSALIIDVTSEEATLLKLQGWRLGLAGPDFFTGQKGCSPVTQDDVDCFRRVYNERLK